MVRLPDRSTFPVLGNLTEEEVKMSSVAREATGFLRLLEVVAQKHPKDVKDLSVLLMGDSQATVAALNNLRSRTTEVNDILKEIFELCVAFKFNVLAVWHPRDELEAKDLLSRQPDSTNWGMKRSLVKQICSSFGVKVAIDLFAWDTWHVTDEFVSQYCTPGCKATQALLQDWRALMATGDFAWIFPAAGAGKLRGRSTDRTVQDKLHLGSARTEGIQLVDQAVCT